MRTQDGPGSEVLCDRAGCLDRSWSGWKREEERVSLRVDFDPAVGGAGVANYPAMLGQRLRICLSAELVQQFCRPLHIGEDEGDRPVGRSRRRIPAGIMCERTRSV